MKNIIFFLSCLLFIGLLSETVLFAQETDPPELIIAPLIDDQVVLIIHIDVHKFDFDQIFEKTILYIENGLKTMNLPQGQAIDARALTNIRTNIQIQFDHMFREFREIRERLIQEADISEIFLVVYQDMVPYMPFIMVSPLKNKTADQRRAFARIVRGAFPILFSERDFMVCAAPFQMNQTEVANQKLRAKLKDLKNSDTAYLRKAFEQQTGSAATIVGVVPPGTPQLIAAFPKSEAFPEVFQKLGIIITERIKWISIGLDVNNVTVKIIGQASNNAEATQILTAITRASANSLEDIIQEAAAKQAAAPNALKLTPAQQEKAIENIRKLQAEFLPVIINENQLLLLLDQDTKPLALGFVVRPLALAYSNFQQIQWGNQCAMNLKTLSTVLQKYAEEKGTYPPVWTTDSEGKPLHSWRVLILPYLDEEELYNSIKLDEPWDSGHNRQFHSKMPTVFRCPASRFANNSTTTYSFVMGPNTYPAGPAALKPEDVTDNPNTTILLVERKNPICWMKPEEITEESALRGVNGVNIDRGIGSDHLAGGCNAVFFDTTIRFITSKAPLDALRKILSYNSGEEIQLP